MLNKLLQRYLKSCIYSAQNIILVAEVHGNIVGIMSGQITKRHPIFKIERVGHVGGTFINPEYRRLGIAEKFLEQIYVWFREKGLDYAELNVHIKNPIGMNALAKHGFDGYMMRSRRTL